MVGGCFGARMAPPGSATFHSPSGGRYLDTGSASSTRPSSTSIMAATEVIGLGHGGDGEDGVGLQRLFAGGVAVAHSFQVRELAGAHDADHAAGDAALLHLAPQRLADAAQPG